MMHQNFYDLRDFLLILINAGGLLKVIFFLILISKSDDRQEEYTRKLKNLVLFMISASLTVTVFLSLVGSYIRLN